MTLQAADGLDNGPTGTAACRYIKPVWHRAVVVLRQYIKKCWVLHNHAVVIVLPTESLWTSQIPPGQRFLVSI